MAKEYNGGIEFKESLVDYQEIQYGVQDGRHFNRQALTCVIFIIITLFLCLNTCFNNQVIQLRDMIWDTIS